MEELRKPTRKASEPGYRDSKRAPSRHKPETLTPETTYTVIAYVGLLLRAWHF
jgi:hypothetical protein